MFGADVDELERLADQFRKSADDLDAEGNRLTGVLNRLSWLGDIASGFLGDWVGVSLPKIGLSTEFLRQAATNLDRQANEQRLASTSVGGGGRSRPSLTSGQEKQLEGLVGQAGDMAGKTPADQAAWWNGLTPEQQQLLIGYRPGAVMLLPGLPPSATDAAHDQYMSDAADEVVVSTDGYELGLSVSLPGTKIGVGGELSAESSTYADGSMDVTVTGEALASLGVPGLGGDAGPAGSITYHFDSAQEAQDFLKGLAETFTIQSRLPLIGGPSTGEYLEDFANKIFNPESVGLGGVLSGSLSGPEVSAGLDASVMLEKNADTTWTLTAASELSGGLAPPESLQVQALRAVLRATPGGNILAAESWGDHDVRVIGGSTAINLDHNGVPQTVMLTYDTMSGTSSGLHGPISGTHTTGTGNLTTIELNLHDPALAEHASSIIDAVKRGDGAGAMQQVEELVNPVALIDRATVTNSTYTLDSHEGKLDLYVVAAGGGHQRTDTTSVTVKAPGGQTEQVFGSNP